MYGVLGMERIELKDAIEALRVELSEAILVSEGKEVRLEMSEIEMEFQVTVEKSKEGNAGLKFGVIEIGSKGGEKDATVHRVKISMKPQWKDGKAIRTGSEEKRL
jgi:hypothetical protein